MNQKDSYATISLTNYPGPNAIMLKILEKNPNLVFNWTWNSTLYWAKEL